MAFSDTGLISHFTRVEQWECDYNRHWNTRFYARSFGYAAEYCFSLQPDTTRLRPQLRQRHIRFHREMMAGSAITLHSARLTGSPQAGGLVHYLYGNDTLSATAVDYYAAPLGKAVALPAVREADCPESQSRGLTAALEAEAASGWEGCPEVPLLTVRPADLDRDGTLYPEVLMRLFAMASHRQLNGLGFTRAFTESTGINRMNAECRVTLADQAPAGSILAGQSRITFAGDRHFVAAHQLRTASGAEVARVELCLLAVDLDTRRVTVVPDFIRAAVL